MADPRCRTCDQTLVVSRVAIDGEYEGTRISAADVPVEFCPQEHQRGLAEPYLSGVIVERMDDQIPLARRAMFKGRDRCRTCKAELGTPDQATPQEFVLAVDHRGAPPEIRVVTRGYRCGACGTVQAVVELRDTGGPAASAAVRGAGFEDG